MDEDSSVLVWL